MKLLKNRTLIAAFCLLLAGIITFMMLPRFYSDRGAVTTVIRAAVPIPRGTLIVEEYLVSAEVGALNLPENAITDAEQILGQYALTDILKDDLILPGKTGSFLFSETLDTLMKKKQKLVTVTLPSNAAGVSGHLLPGDIVSVICYIEAHERFETDEATGFDIRENIPAQTRMVPELQDITVYAVENAKTEKIDELEADDDMQTDPIPKTVTLIVSKEQALKLVEAEYTGKIHLIFERRDA
jgi:pilus assembly protein CpaB